MNNINPLARSSGKQATYGDRVEQLENSNLWQKSVENAPGASWPNSLKFRYK